MFLVLQLGIGQCERALTLAARISIEAANTPFAQHHLLVVVAHDLLGCYDQLLAKLGPGRQLTG